MKKRVLVLNLIIVATVIFVFILLIIRGGFYRNYTRIYFPGAAPGKESCRFDKEGVVRLAGYTMAEDGEIILDFEAVGKGDTVAHVVIPIVYEDGSLQHREIKIDLSVNALGIIVDRTDSLNFSGYMIVIYAILFILLLVSVFMVWMFFSYNKNGGFSYPMVACGGIGVFTFILLEFSIYKLFNNSIRTFGHFLAIVYDIGRIFLLFLSAVMLVLMVFMFISNIFLIFREGYRFVNSLGIIAALMWAFVSYLIYLPWNDPANDVLGIAGFRLLYIVQWLLTYVACYFESMFISTVFCAYLSTRYTPKYDKDYIIILGCGIRKDGTPTPLLKSRVDAAMKFWVDQKRATGKKAIYIPSGGQGPDEVISESEAMANYLLGCGVSPERILREDKSTTTYQNMKFSKKVIDDNSQGEVRAAFATSNYHVFRGYTLANDVGLDAEGVSAKTKAYFYPNAFLREFIGLLYNQRFKHIGIVAMLMAFFGLIYLI